MIGAPEALIIALPALVAAVAYLCVRAVRAVW